MIALAFLIGTVAQAQGIGDAALPFAQGVAALQAGDYPSAESSCREAAMVLGQIPDARAELGRAQLCVVDALAGQNRAALAFDLLASAIRNLEAEAAAAPRYQADLDRAMSLVGPLSRRIGRIQLAIAPPAACEAAAQPAITVDGIAIDARPICDGRSLDVDAGRRTIAVSASGYRADPIQVDAVAGEARPASVTLEPDLASGRWLSLRLHEPETTLVRWDGERCPAPCDLVVERAIFLQGAYTVEDDDGPHAIDYDVLDPNRVYDVELVSSGGIWGWILAITGGVSLLVGAPIAAAVWESGEVAAVFGGVGLGAILTGVLWGILAGGDFYSLE
jgi:hypothetical protein